MPKRCFYPSYGYRFVTNLNATPVPGHSLENMIDIQLAARKRVMDRPLIRPFISRESLDARSGARRNSTMCSDQPSSVPIQS
jgi:hypothetical protein